MFPYPVCSPGRTRRTSSICGRRKGEVRFGLIWTDLTGHWSGLVRSGQEVWPVRLVFKGQIASWKADTYNLILLSYLYLIKICKYLDLDQLMFLQLLPIDADIGMN